MAAVYPHAFEGQITRFGVGNGRKIWYNVIFLPETLKAQLPFDTYPRLRVDGEIADVPISNAFMPAGDGRVYVIVSPAVLKSAGVKLGDNVEMRFRIADQNLVALPAELNTAINSNTRHAKAWDALTPGKQRMLAQHVLSAKTAPTRTRRIEEAMDALLTAGGDLRRWRKARE